MTRERSGACYRLVLAGMAIALASVLLVGLATNPVAGTAPTEVDGDEIGDEPRYAGERFNVTFSEAPFNQSDDVYLFETGPDPDDQSEWVFEDSYENVSTTAGEFRAEDVDTTGLDGYYVFGNSTIPADVTDPEQFLVIDEEFEASWADEVATGDDDDVRLEIDSRRSASDLNVTISADGLDYDELNATFVHEGTDVEEVTDPAHLPLDRLGYDRTDGDDVTELRDDGYITLELSNSSVYDDDGEVIANITSLDEREGLPARGEYDFDVRSTETGSTDSSALTIGETQAEFDQDLYTRAAGDLVEITVELSATDEAWIQFGDEDAGFVDILYVEDETDSDDVTFTANTRLIGTDHREIVSSRDTDVVYYSEDDTVESYIHDEEIHGGSNTVSQAKFFDDPELDDAQSLDFDEYLRELELIGANEDPEDQLARPLQPSDYDLVADRRHHFIADDGETSVDDRIGSAELDLVQPSVRDVTTYTGPGGDADDVLAVEDLRDDLTERDTVAIGDRAIAGFETTGLVGSLATIDYVENDNDITDGLEEGFSPNVLSQLAVESSDWKGDGIRFGFDGPEQPNREENTLTLETAADRDTFVLTDLQQAENDPGYLYVVVDSEAGPFERSLADGERFDVELEYLGAEERYRFADSSGVHGGADGDRDDPAFPYYPAEFSATADSAVTFETPWVTFDRMDEGIVQVAPEDGAIVSGQTNVAPGTDASVSVRLPPPDGALPDEDPSFLASDSVDIQSDGSFTAELDLDDRVLGEEADVVFAVDDESIETVDGRFSDIDDVRAPYFEATVDVPESVDPGSAFGVNATVRNVGDDAGTGDFRLMVDDDVVTSESLDLEPGEETTVETTVDAGEEDGTIELLASTPDEATSSTVVVGAGADTGTESGDDDTDAADDTVDEQDPLEEEPDDGMLGGAIPGFGAGIAALALVLSVVIARIVFDRPAADGSSDESVTGKN